MGLFDKIVSMVGKGLSEGSENKGLMERFRNGESGRGIDRRDGEAVIRGRKN